MSRNNDTSSKKAIWIGGLCALVIAAALGVSVWRSQKTGTSPGEGPREPQRAAAPKGPETVRQPVPTPPQEEPDRPAAPVVDYGKLKEDETLQTLMDKRKEKYGVEQGVDLIVKPNESVKVGDTVVPMNEILDRIRLKEGEMVEQDLAAAPVDTDKAVAAELNSVKERYEQLDTMIKDPAPSQDNDKTDTYIKEREQLEKIVTAYEDYKDTVQKIEEKKKMLAALNQEAPPAGPKPAVGSARAAATAAAEIPARIPAPGSQPAPSPAAPGKGTAPAGSDSPASTAPAAPAPSPAVKAPGPVQEAPVAEAAPPSEVNAGTKQPQTTPEPEANASTGGESQAAPTPTPSETAPDERVIQEAPVTEAALPPAVNGGTVTRPTAPRAVPAPGVSPARSASRKASRRIAVESLKKEIQQEINMLLLQKSDLENELLLLLKKEKRPEAYGIYVVQKSDNIWNIHYTFLKDYFRHREIDLSGDADEPDRRGRSSGVGKILKFSEKMVYIYNIRERELASDINLIHPLSKIVVFNMAKVFGLLENVDYRDMDQIQFDGENIWLPAKS